MLPAFADLHTHLDKTYSPIDNPEGGLEGAISAFRDYKAKRTPKELETSASLALRKAISPVSYTHLTLPTKRIV